MDKTINDKEIFSIRSSLKENIFLLDLDGQIQYKHPNTFAVRKQPLL